MLCYKSFKSLNILKCFYSTLKCNTIFALSSGKGKCGVAVIRISGSEAGSALKQITNMQSLPKPREALLKFIRNPNSGEILDRGLVLWFPGPRSFTGEDCFEVQVHGGIAVVSAILNTLGNIEKLRMAEPGEFTKRAFMNGKLNLTEVEGLADLIHAETEAQRKQAFLQSQGSLSKLYEKWKDELIKSVAYIEAHIDFDETETLEDDLLEQIDFDIKKLRNEVEKHLIDGRKGERLRDGVKAIILGEPNVGKSSILNILCQRPAAIVTPIEGTTRDVLEVSLNIGGYPIILADTAGLRYKSDDVIEKEGINRALDYYKRSDLILLVVDVTKYLRFRKLYPQKSFEDYLKAYVDELKLTDFEFNKNSIIILNKIDLVNECDLENHFGISCKDEHGFPELIHRITERLIDLCGKPSSEHPSMNQIRHRQHLSDCSAHLELFLTNSNKTDAALKAEQLRRALGCLGKLTGIVTTEQLLDVVFRDFCIGK